MTKSNFRVIFGDDIDELFVINSSIAIFVSKVNHLVDFSRRKILTYTGSNFLKLLSSESSCTCGVERFKYWLKSSFAGRVSSEAENVEENSEVHLSCVAGVVDDSQDLSSLSFEVKGTYSIDELVSRDISAPVIIKDIKDFLQFGDSWGVEILSDVLVGIESFGWSWSFGHFY